jgi:exonuclease SbcC
VRPLRLEMVAVGPFLSKTTIDFDRFSKGDLFLVHGPTGIGKSFIFDAICYALFGETPSHRSSHLRSDYARRDIEPSIVFSFELDSNVYRVTRKLEYLRTPKRKAASDTIVERETGRLEKLASWPGGEPRLITSKKSAIRKTCVELLGLDADQFFQVVVLPQGEFQRVLLADTSSREALLEKLFDASIFADMQNALSDQRQQKERTVQEDLKVKAVLLEGTRASIPADVLSEGASIDRSVLRGAIERIASELPAIEARVDRSTAALNQSSEALATARALSTKFQEYSDLIKQSYALEIEEQQQIAPLEKAVEADRAAAKIISDVERLERCREELRQIKDELLSLQDALNSATERLTQARSETARLGDLNQKRDAAASEIARLQPLNRLSRELDEHAIELNQKKIALERDTRDLRAAEENYKNLKREIEQMEAERKSLRSKSDDLLTIQKTLSEAEDHLARLQQMEALQKKVAELNRIRQQKQAEREGFQRELLNLRTRREGNLASELAAKLQAGKPCPVCGSQSHPDPAKPSDEHASLEAIQKAESRHSDAVRQLADIEATVEQNRVRIEEMRGLLGRVGEKQQLWPIEGSEAFVPAVSDLREKLALQMRNEKKRVDLEKRIETSRTQVVPQIETALSDATRKHDVARKAYLEIEFRTNEKKQRWKAETQECGRLQLQLNKSREQQLGEWIGRLETERLQVSTEIKRLRDAEQEALLRLTSIQEQTNAKREQLRALSAKQEDLQKTTDRVIEETHFKNAEEVRHAYQNDLWREQAHARIDAFKKNRAENTALLERLARELEGKRPPDLDKLEKDRALNQKISQDDILASQESKDRLKTLQKVEREIDQLDKRCGVLQEELEILGKLDDQVRGQGKPKVSLKRFFLAQRLEEVLIQASHRLIVLSRGRFILRRDRDEAIKHQSGQTGLNLNIFDSHTGLERPASTLSGGQIFLASLSLALGLADIVQARSGGITIEALFIDEGFGSLDEETLQLALEVLDQLRQGRMVGVISHIADLRRQVGNRIEVHEAAIGSTARLIQDNR